MQFLHLKNSPKVLFTGGLQTKVFELACRGIKRKCVRMIQPVSAFNPQATFRGSSKTFGKKSSGEISRSNIALLNAGGVAAAAGGITTAVARGYTSSWAHASVLGLFGAFLALFFMTPQLIDRTTQKKAVKEGDSGMITKAEAKKALKSAEEYLKPAKKLVQFRSDAVPANS